MKPICADVFCGLGGWTEGALAAGYDVFGFDIERRPYPAQLILQDALTIHGSQLRNVNLILCSPPCQEFSYRAMPWKIAKAMKPDILPDWWKLTEAQMDERQYAEWDSWRERNPLPPPDLRLFEACFRIQKEAIDAQDCDCGHPDSDHDHDYLNRMDDDCRKCSCTSIRKRYIPMVLENVRGIQKYVGKSKANFGSFHLYGDVGMVGKRIVAGLPQFGSTVRPARDGVKVASDSGRRTDVGNGVRFTSRDCGIDAIKQGGDWFNAESGGISRTTGSKSPARRANSAKIAKIPFPLAFYIAKSFHPDRSSIQ